MKTVYLAGRRWQDRAPRGGEGKVVDLAAWKAENLITADEPPRESGPGRYGDREPGRRRDRTAWDWTELAATLAAAAVMAALAVRVLLF